MVLHELLYPKNIFMWSLIFIEMVLPVLGLVIWELSKSNMSPPLPLWGLYLSVPVFSA